MLRFSFSECTSPRRRSNSIHPIHMATTLRPCRLPGIRRICLLAGGELGARTRLLDAVERAIIPAATNARAIRHPDVARHEVGEQAPRVGSDHDPGAALAPQFVLEDLERGQRDPV